MAHPKARWEKGSPETQARMAAVSAKAKEAREAKASPAPNRKPFVSSGFSATTVDVNEFTGVLRGFPQMSFGPNFLPEQVKTQTWPGDK